MEQLPLLDQGGPLQPHDRPPGQEPWVVGGAIKAEPHPLAQVLSLLSRQEGTRAPVSTGVPTGPVHPPPVEVVSKGGVDPKKD